MAVTQIQTSNGQPPPERRPVGRPPGSKTKNRANGAESTAASAASLSRTDPFRTILPALTAEDWQQHSLYLYRQNPITDRRGPGRAKNIMKYGEAIDEQRVMLEHGSGRYKADLVFHPPEGGPNRYVFQYSFEIMNPAYPPKIPKGDWLDDPRNSEWAWCREAIVNPTEASGSAADQVIKLLREVRPDLANDEQQGLASQIVDLVKDNQEQMRAMMNPATQLETLKTFMELIPKPAPPPPNTASDKIYDLLMEERKAMREEIRELRSSIMNRPPEKSILQQLTELEPVADRITKLFGRGKAERVEPTNIWADIASKAIDELLPIGTRLVGLMMMNPRPGAPQPGGHAGDAAGSPAPAMPGTALQRRTAARPAAAAPGQPAPAQPEAAAAPVSPLESLPEEERNAMYELIQKYGALISQVVPFLHDHYQHYDGYAFRDWFMTRKGTEAWSGLRSEVGTDKLIQFAKFDPQLWQALQPEEKFRAFMADFWTEPGQEREGYNETPPEE